jgi:hypothetical protein
VVEGLGLFTTPKVILYIADDDGTFAQRTIALLKDGQLQGKPVKNGVRLISNDVAGMLPMAGPSHQGSKSPNISQKAGQSNSELL